MAPIKRGAATEDRPGKKAKHSDGANTGKFQHRTQTKSSRDSSKPSSRTSEHKPRTEAKSSVLQAEERAFPRGGASVLSPLEHKQIQIQATRDVLFEQSGASRREQQFDDEESSAENVGPARPLAKKRRRTKAEKQDEDIKDESQVKVEGLSYKRLVPGSMVLGQVSSITSHHIVLALPNNISGFIPITNISDQLNERIEKLLQEQPQDDDSDNGLEDIEDIDIHEFAHVGQYLRAYVTSTEEEMNTGHNKRKIELSVNPRHANAGLTRSDIAVGMTVAASVVSIEDHGLVMDLGFDDASSAFLSSKELGSTFAIENVQEGTSMLCNVISKSSDGKLLKLSAHLQTSGNVKKGHFLKDAPSIDGFLPGTAVDLLVTETNSFGIAGKIMGMLDATADVIHSGAGVATRDLAQRFPNGSRTKARIICTFPESDHKKVGVSVLDHLVSLSPSPGSHPEDALHPLKVLPISSFVDHAKVTKVRPGVGLFMDIGGGGIRGFAHISPESGRYKVGTVHRARVVGYNAIDGLYLVSLEQKILEQPFLRVDDVQVGQIVKGKIEKLIINERGVGGVLVILAEGIKGLVPEMHLADVHLQHPERKFKEGMEVSARVLFTHPEKNVIRLTLKKTLVNSDSTVWNNFTTISPGAESPGTIIKLIPSGAVVQFYGNVRGFLPVSEISDSFIKDPSQHFRLGQVITVRALDVDPNEEKLTVSCRSATVLDDTQEKAFAALSVGSIVGGTVTEKSLDSVSINLDESNLRATLRVNHLTDGSEQKNSSAQSRIRIGQKLQDLVVLNKKEFRRLIELSHKPSLVKASRSGKLISKFEDLQENEEVSGFVRNITLQNVFVEFAGGVTGLLWKSKLEDGAADIPDFGLRIGQSISARVVAIDHAQQHFLLSQRSPGVPPTDKPKENSALSTGDVINPVDGVSTTKLDYTMGKTTKARITAVKRTQINVQLADNVQGRVDASEAFDTWEDIEDHNRPLRAFKPGEIIDVTVLGVHDAKNHRFLPITHRAGQYSVFELSAKPSRRLQGEVDVLALDKVQEGSSWTAYINNVNERCVWVNLSPNVRGRIALMDLCDDISRLNDLHANFPVGSAVKVRVRSVDRVAQRLDLVAEEASGTERLTLDDLSKGMLLPGRVAKVTEWDLIIQLSKDVFGLVGLTELVDDFSKANPTTHNRDDIVRVCVLDVDKANKKVFLSMRPSKVLSSSSPVQDPHVASVSQLKVNDVVRGFVRNTADQGVFVSLSHSITAFVRVSDLSDAFIKDWKPEFEAGKLVKGKVISIDESLNHVHLSLKESLLNKDYVPPLKLENVKVGQVVTGKIRKVENFGVFILVDNSNHLSGLCHHSEIADGPVEDVRKIYSEGDRVKAVVVKVDLQKRRVNFGLKASYFQDNAGTDSSEEDIDEDGGVLLDASEEVNDEEMEDQVQVSDPDDIDPNDDEADHMSVDEDTDKPSRGLSTGGFDWVGGNLEKDAEQEEATDADTANEPKKKKRRKPEVKVDKTGDLDKHGPQSVADYERQLLGQPNSSSLWIQYMAFYLQLNEVDTAREIAERALKTIHIREEDEKLNVWVALLNLENAYGSDETVEEVFKRACQYNDAQEIHERLASIYIDSGKHAKADDLFQAMTKTKGITVNPSFWLNYATFLMTTLSSAARARALLPRALQSVPQFNHRLLTSKFGGLEFQSPNGDPERGRTIFEGLLDSFPKRWDLWDMFVDLEKAHGEPSNRWLEFEEAHGDRKSVERVRAKAAEHDSVQENAAEEED
ncbi:nucleic acid-binding protein [Rhizodiscina lignyota]|uniref:Nucleic acid-binding protein n=1 Tax=Rhizodiscina lignyota TaxID=1504668 RepID=A0A9P4MBW5_9PEZI|nr:nucleic acid-binding protein [Rhizodiscina lignyota]